MQNQMEEINEGYKVTQVTARTLEVELGWSKNHWLSIRKEG